MILPTVVVAGQFAFALVAHGAKFVQVADPVVGAVPILVVDFGHSHSPGRLIIVDGAVKSQMPVLVAATTCLEWRNSWSVGLPTVAGLLAVCAMHSPPFVALGVFFAVGHRLVATMVDTDGTELVNFGHVTLLCCYVMQQLYCQLNFLSSKIKY